MKKHLILLAVIITCATSYSQNVGIGTNLPIAKLHVSGDDSLVIVESTNPLSTGSSRLYFKTGSFYTGSISAIGTGLNTARVGISTFAGLNFNSLQERLSILDNGYVGIGNIAPAFKLDVNGETHVGGNFYADGNVGIGTVSPAAKLEVKGTTRLVQDVAASAVEIDGKIKVTGGTKAAFIMTVAAEDLSNSNHTITINHPFCNSDPNALLFITARELDLGFAGYIVQYNVSLSRWQIVTDGYNIDYTFSQGNIDVCDSDFCGSILMVHPRLNKFKAGDKFNILIITTN